MVKEGRRRQAPQRAGEGNRQLKEIVADQQLENMALKEDRQGKFKPGLEARGCRSSDRATKDSERRACRYLGQNRSTQRRKPVTTDAEKELSLAGRLRQEAPRYGYKRAHAIAIKNGFRVNCKRVQRLWREEGLKVSHKAKKKSRVGT